VVNISRGARVGVRVGAVVRVGVALELGEMVNVGDWVLVAVTVEVLVSLGAIVHIGDGFGVAVMLQATCNQATSTNQNNVFRCFLWANGEERVMIIDLPMRNSKGVISIAYKTLRRGRCPGKVARASLTAVTSQGELALG
jgi:hypothetical protein